MRISIKHAAAIVRHLPLRKLHFEKLTAAQCPKVAAVPALAQVRDLSLYNHKIGNKGAKAFFDSPHLGGLIDLDLNATGLTTAAMKPLARSASLRNLKKLELSGNPIYDSGIADLTEAEGWQPLEEFEGYSLGLSRHVAPWLADAAIFSRLTNLKISQNWLEDRGVARLMQGTTATWRNLDLGQNQVGDAGAEALAASPRVAWVEELCLRDNTIGAAGVRAVAGSRHLKNLRRLELTGGDAVGDEGARALAGSRFLKRLTDLTAWRRWRGRPTWRTSATWASATTPSGRAARRPSRRRATCGT